MPEAPTTDPKSWLDHPLSHLASWRAHQCARAEREGQAPTAELDQVLADVGLNRSDLPAILALDPDSPEGLRQMAARLGISPQTLALGGGQRELRRRCLDCRDKDPCGQWLKQAQAPEAAPGFCPNAAELSRIRKLATAVTLFDLF
jgi:hypothetical protein